MDLRTGRTVLWKSLPDDGDLTSGNTVLARDGAACAYGSGRLQAQLYLLEGMR
ncbi:MAG TPA: hypothetical protein VMK66_13075 [Myxococcales bacterium]|nr:hypothetical protein [Myxococcales bacterium]